MEKKECKHKLCKNEFPQSNKTRLFCSRGCKSKHNNRVRYYEDRDYYNSQNESAKVSYEKKKKVSYKRLSELTDDELEHLKSINPQWFETQNND